MAAYRVLASRGVEPQIAAGHSLGEYAACAAAGVMSFADAIRALQARGKFMQEAVPEGQGAMAAVLGLDADAVRDMCKAAAEETKEIVSPANLNSPEHIVISGERSGRSAGERTGEGKGREEGGPAKVSAALPLCADAAGAGAVGRGAEGGRGAGSAFPDRFKCHRRCKSGADGSATC